MNDDKPADFVIDPRHVLLENHRLRAQVAALTAEHDQVRRQADDATEYALAQINNELRARVAELEAERDRYREAFAAETEVRQAVERELEAALAKEGE